MTGEMARLDDQTVLAQYGPMRLTIQAWDREGVALELAAKAGEFSFTLLPRLAPARDIFRRELNPQPDQSEPLLNQMILAARQANREDLGPMATVAGTVAETVAVHLRGIGATKAIVENGGDLAILLDPGYTAAVGLRLGVDKADPEYKFTLSGDARRLWGVCSSGLGGRSLTRGIADTAMVVAASTPVADAVATALGNACMVDSPNIRQAPAETLRPDTDIRGLSVTEWVGELTKDEIAEALRNAMAYAGELVASDVILGAIVCLRGEVRMTEGFEERVAPLERL